MSHEEPVIDIGVGNLPVRLLHAQEKNNLIVFCGAGVSAQQEGTLSHFGSFKALYEAIAARYQMLPVNSALPENFDFSEGFENLTRESHLRDSVQDEVCLSLANENAIPTEYHTRILQLTKKIITTNFDRLFDKAVPKSEKPIRTFCSPTFPVYEFNENFHGIVYLHGHIDRPESLILSTSDFASAYTYPGFVSRFLGDILHSHEVLFIGYSVSDEPFQKLLKAVKRFKPSDRKLYVLDCEGKDFPPEVTVIQIEPGTRSKYKNIQSFLEKWAQYKDESEDITAPSYLPTFSGETDRFRPAIKIKLLEEKIRKEDCFRHGNQNVYNWIFNDPDLFKLFGIDLLKGSSYQGFQGDDQKTLLALKDAFKIIARRRLREVIWFDVHLEPLDITLPIETLIHEDLSERVNGERHTERYIHFQQDLSVAFSKTLEVLGSDRVSFEEKCKWLNEFFGSFDSCNFEKLIVFMRENEDTLSPYVFSLEHETARQGLISLFRKICSLYKKSSLPPWLAIGEDTDRWLLAFSENLWKASNKFNIQHKTKEDPCDWHTAGINHIGGSISEYWIARFGALWNSLDPSMHSLSIFEKELTSLLMALFNNRTYTAYGSIGVIGAFSSLFFMGENPMEKNTLLNRLARGLSYEENNDKEQWRALWHGIAYSRHIYTDFVKHALFEKALSDSIGHILELKNSETLSERDPFTGKFMEFLMLNAKKFIKDNPDLTIKDLAWWTFYLQTEPKIQLEWWIALAKEWRTLPKEEEDRFVTSVIEPSFETLNFSSIAIHSAEDWALSMFFRVRSEQLEAFLRILEKSLKSVQKINFDPDGRWNYQGSYFNRGQHQYRWLTGEERIIDRSYAVTS